MRKVGWIDRGHREINFYRDATVNRTMDSNEYEVGPIAHGLLIPRKSERLIKVVLLSPGMESRAGSLARVALTRSIFGWARVATRARLLARLDAPRVCRNIAPRRRMKSSEKLRKDGGFHEINARIAASSWPGREIGEILDTGCATNFPSEVGIASWNFLQMNLFL